MTITGQVLDLDWEAEPRNAHGRWAQAPGGSGKPKFRAAKFRAAGGHTVTVVHTADRGQFFQVTTPNGYTVPLDPWNPQGKAEIRTTGQLAAVLARQGEDLATLEEVAPHAAAVSLTAQAAGSITGQLLDLSAASRAKAHATASATAKRTAAEHHELRNDRGEWTKDLNAIMAVTRDVRAKTPAKGDFVMSGGLGAPVRPHEITRVLHDKAADDDGNLRTAKGSTTMWLKDPDTGTVEPQTMRSGQAIRYIPKGHPAAQVPKAGAKVPPAPVSPPSEDKTIAQQVAEAFGVSGPEPRPAVAPKLAPAPPPAPAPVVVPSPPPARRGKALTGAAIHDELGKPALSSDQETAISAYYAPTPATGYLNDYLHGKKFNGPVPAAQHQTAAMDSAFDQAKTTAVPMVMYRGLSDKGLTAGKVFSDDGYVSATSEPKIADGYGNKVVRIHVPAGSKALSVALMTGENPHNRLSSDALGITDAVTGDAAEREVLLPRGSRFQVTGKSGKFTDVDLLPAVPAKPSPAAQNGTIASQVAAKPAAPAVKTTVQSPSQPDLEIDPAARRTIPEPSSAAGQRMIGWWATTHTGGFRYSMPMYTPNKRQYDFALELHRMLTGSSSPPVKRPGTQDAHDFLRMIGKYSVPQASPLYRGLKRMDASKARELFPPGGVVDLPVASFTTNKRVSDRYASSSIAYSDIDRKNVVLTVEPGAMGLDLGKESGESQVLSGGRFKVSSFQESGDITYITLAQQDFSAR